MSVQYTGIKPDRNYSVTDFRDHGIILMSFMKFKSGNDNIPSLRIIFRSNGLLGEIRTTCYGNAYAVDVEWGWYSDRRQCITTECKSLREAKSILFMWFKSKGFKRTTEQIKAEPYASYLSLNNVQLRLFATYIR
jgi:hypothetical protein